MWSAVLLICLSEGFCQGQMDPVIHPTEELCQMSVEVGAAHFYNQGWIITDFRCIEWGDKDEET